MTRKLIIHDGRSERELVLVGTLTVGRDPSCHISDLDPLLSRRHAEFVTTTQACTVRDLGSRNGILVNGQKVREQQLKEGDLVQLGHLQLRYAEDHAVITPETESRSHATTAHDAATIAAAAATPAAALEDTRPHPPHAHAGHDDADITRLPAGHKDEEPTMAPRGAAAAPAAAVVADIDATVAPVRKTAPAIDLDATMAPGGRVADPDATFVAGAMLPPAQRPTVAMANTDFDATGMGRPSPDLAAALAADLDKTIAPGSLSAHLDATFVAGAKLPAALAAAVGEARLTAGADLRITTASPGCRVHFDVPLDALIGRPLGDVLAERLKAVSADGPAELTLAVDRASSDRSLIVILKAVQVETVS